MSGVAHLFAVQKVCDVAEEISRPLGKVLFGFSEKRQKKHIERLNKHIERFIGLLYSFDAVSATEEALETVEECCTKVIAALTKFSSEPYYQEAVGKISEAANWISRGYAPSRPPSEEELASVREKHTKRLLEVLSK